MARPLGSAIFASYATNKGYSAELPHTVRQTVRSLEAPLSLVIFSLSDFYPVLIFTVVRHGYKLHRSPAQEHRVTG